MKLTVTTTPIKLPVQGGAPVIQNLGPGVVYMDSVSQVDANTGVKITVGNAYEFAKRLGSSAGVIWLVATQTSDVRYMEVG